MADRYDIESWLVPSQVFEGGTLKNDVALGLKDGQVAAIASASAANAAILNPTTGIPEIPAGSPKSGSGPDSDEGMF